MMRVPDQKSSTSSNCLPFSFSDASTMKVLLSAQVALAWPNRKKWNELITTKIILNSITSSRMARQPVEADKVVQWCVYPIRITNEGRNQLLSGSLVVHKTSTMKNDHNSFLSYFSREEPESIGLRFTYIATSILLKRQWSIGSPWEIPRGRYSIREWLTRPIPISIS